MKKTILMMIIAVGLMASQALNPSVIKTYKQPDGTIFKGYLKGTAALSWIESNNNLVKYNVDDRYYYKIDIVDSKIVYVEKYIGSVINKSINRSSANMKDRDNSMIMILQDRTEKMELGQSF
jgi:hypothetical protein